MGNFYRQHQNTDYISKAGNIAQGIKETAVKGSYDPRALGPGLTACDGLSAATITRPAQPRFSHAQGLLI